MKRKKEKKQVKMYIMRRVGNFIPENMTSNQCGKEGVTNYTYNIVLLLPSVLDSDGFCIDHDKLDQTIQNCCIQGSCEEMQIQIFKAIKGVCKLNKVKFFGYACTIFPKGENLDLPANITYTQGKRKYLNYLKT